MTIANTVLNTLQQNNMPYTIIAHPRTYTSKTTADTAHVPAERLAKAVVLAGDGGYVLAVIPSDRHVKLEAVSRKIGRQLALAPENRIATVFKDCDVGAIPPLGMAYGVPTLLDDSLMVQPDVFFEAGDHEELVQVKGDHFVSLLKDAQHGQFST